MIFYPPVILVVVAVISVAVCTSRAIQVFKDGLDSRRHDDD